MTIPKVVPLLALALASYDTPLQAVYSGLDPNARYRVRLEYAGDSSKKMIRLVANENLEVHPYMARPRPVSHSSTARCLKALSYFIRDFLAWITGSFIDVLLFDVARYLCPPNRRKPLDPIHLGSNRQHIEGT